MENKLKKSLTMPKETERGTLWDFSTSILSENIQKFKGDPLVIFFFRKKSLTEPKILQGSTLWPR